mmetsp:Transcript_55184/g.147282  ORF Transcript_55184/g.147282 Transcript_55184/m.147282 type:complete len:590 (-) Transcript_55184:242-2011(-)
MGLATQLHDSVMASATMCGSPAYLSPEEAAGTDHYTDKCDMWALGVILYELNSENHRLPFVGHSLPHLLEVIKTQAPKPLPAGTPVPLREICDELLQNDPDCRPSASELTGRPLVTDSARTHGCADILDGPNSSFTDDSFMLLSGKRRRDSESSDDCTQCDVRRKSVRRYIVNRLQTVTMTPVSFQVLRPGFHMKSYCEVCRDESDGTVDCSFTPLKRRHHCRMCGRSVCLEHAVGRRALPQLGYKKPQLLCETCFLLPRDIATRKVKDGRGRPRSAARHRRSCRRRAHSVRVESFHRVRAERAHSVRGRAHSVRVGRARSPDPECAERLARSRSTTPTAPRDVSPAPLTEPRCRGRYLPLRKGLLPFRQCFRSHAEDERKSSDKISEKPEADKVPVEPEQEPASAKDATRERSHRLLRLLRRTRRDASPPTSEVTKFRHGEEPEKEAPDAPVRSDPVSGHHRGVSAGFHDSRLETEDIFRTPSTSILESPDQPSAECGIVRIPSVFLRKSGDGVSGSPRGPTGRDRCSIKEGIVSKLRSQFEASLEEDSGSLPKASVSHVVRSSTLQDRIAGFERRPERTRAQTAPPR